MNKYEDINFFEIIKENKYVFISILPNYDMIFNIECEKSDGRKIEIKTYHGNIELKLIEYMKFTERDILQMLWKNKPIYTTLREIEGFIKDAWIICPNRNDYYTYYKNSCEYVGKAIVLEEEQFIDIEMISDNLNNIEIKIYNELSLNNI